MIASKLAITFLVALAFWWGMVVVIADWIEKKTWHINVAVYTWIFLVAASLVSLIAGIWSIF